MTAPKSHNDGPIIIDAHPDDNMYYAPWDFDDFLGGVQKLRPNAIGIYAIILNLIYKHMGALLDNDRYIAGHCDCDVRTYRDLKKALIASGKIRVIDGYIYNNRAMEEIAKFCATAKRKREAAADREARKRDAASKPVQAEVAQTLRASCAEPAQALREVRTETAQELRKNCTEKEEKPNEINATNTTAVVVESHGGGRPVVQIEKEKETEEVSKKKGQPAIVPGETLRAGGPDELPGLNGATAMIVTDVAKWLSPWTPDEPGAYKHIGEAIRIYGERAVRDGYAEMKADIADGKIRAPSVKSLYGYFRVAKDRPPSKTAGGKPPLVNSKGWVRT